MLYAHRWNSPRPNSPLLSSSARVHSAANDCSSTSTNAFPADENVAHVTLSGPPNASNKRAQSRQIHALSYFLALVILAFRVRMSSRSVDQTSPSGASTEGGGGGFSNVPCRSLSCSVCLNIETEAPCLRKKTMNSWRVTCCDRSASSRFQRPFSVADDNLDGETSTPGGYDPRTAATKSSNLSSPLSSTSSALK